MDESQMYFDLLPENGSFLNFPEAGRAGK